jgi:hypothetical protein
LSSWDEKASFCELPGDGRNVAPLKPIENDHEGGTRSAGNGLDAFARSADVGGIRNADEIAGFVGTSWDVRGFDKIGGPEGCAREGVERKSRIGTRRVMDIIKKTKI